MTAERLVLVPEQAVKLLASANIKPPAQEGVLLDPHLVDDKLAASGLTIDQRIAAKIFLRRAGLLKAGRAISDWRR